MVCVMVDVAGTGGSRIVIYLTTPRIASFIDNAQDHVSIWAPRLGDSVRPKLASYISLCLWVYTVWEDAKEIGGNEVMSDCLLSIMH